MKKQRLIDLIVFQLEHNPVHTVSLVGRMGRGKTNFMRYLARSLEPLGYRIYYVQAPEPQELAEIIKSLDPGGDRVALMVDDMSFLALGRSDEIRQLENAIARIRHLLGTGDHGHVLLAIAYHYHRSINVFLRMTDTIVLFDLTSKEEVGVYRERFRERMLWEFYRLYDAYLWRNPRLVKTMKKKGLDPDKWRPVLAKVVNRELLAWVPYVPPEEVDWIELDAGAGHGAQETRKKTPPITWDEFRSRVRNEFKIRARDDKLHRLYSWIFYELLGYRSRNPRIEEEEEAPKTRAQEPALAPA